MSLRIPKHARSLLPHAAGLFIIMIVALPIVGWHGVVSSDEGAGIAQARAIGKTGSFFLPHPFPQADRTGAAFPLGALVTEDGFAPLAKKPAYTVALATVDRVGGVPGMLLLSIVGTVAASTCAAGVAGHLRPEYRVLTFWVTGLASPLFTDGYLVIAHTLGAAFCAAALLGVVLSMERTTVARAAMIGIALVVAVSLRREAALFGAALALALGAVAAWNRNTRTAITALAALAGTIGGYLLDRVLAAAAFGTGVTGLGELGGVGNVVGENFATRIVRPFITTWLSPAYGGLDGPALLLIVLAITGAGAAVTLRKTNVRAQRVRMLGVAVIALSAAGTSLLTVTQPHLVPGLLPAFPLLIWGLVLLGGATLAPRPAQVLLLTFTLFAAAVIATQGAVGGGWEWGGRYFAVGLPAVTPLIAAGLMETWRRLDARTARLCAGAVVSASLALSVTGLASIRYFHDGWSHFVGTVSEVVSRTDAGDGGSPVVVSTEPELPRAAWREMEHSRWLLVSDDGVGAMLRRLSRLHVEEMVFVSKGDVTERAIRNSPYTVQGVNPAPQEHDTWWIATLHLR